ncbi:integrase core domain-containing protein [Phthorimaea operculella]|nr:integrase core domain-containing protein [Phthorimaea operculella]
MGPLPVTRKQNSYILVVTCCFSKFCLITPLRAATAVSVCKFLEDSVFLVHGIPQTVYLDNGSQFISKHTESLFERYKIPNIFFTPKYTPQINTVERYNRTIITCVSTYVDDDHRSWDIFLPKIQFAMNNSVSEATGFTPSFLVYGREIVTCGSHYVDNDLGDEILFLPRDIYAENLGCLSELFTNVQSKLWHAHIKNASHYNTRRKPLEFRVGDLVMKRTYVLSNKDKYFCKKLAPKFIKCRVIAKKSPLVYVLEDMSRKTLELGILKILNRYYAQQETPIGELPSGLLPTELLPYGLRNIQKNISATHYTHDGGLSEVKTLPAVPAHY